MGLTNNSTDEDDEVFSVDLTSAAGATVSATARRAQITILDDDAPPTLTIGSGVAVPEGNSGTSGTCLHHG